MENKKIILHVGFHKSGSTFVQNYFEKHPDIFFSREVLKDFISDYHAEIPQVESLVEQDFIFLSDMRLTVNSWGQSEFERVNSNGLSLNDIRKVQKEIALKLKERFPQAEVLITTRDKEQLLDSLYSQYLLNGGRKSVLKFKADSKNIEILFDYGYIIVLYREIFGAKQVHQFSFNKLKENSSKYVEEICSINDFPFKNDNFKIVNESLSKTAKRKIRLRNSIVYYLLFLLPKSSRNTYFKKFIKI